MKRSRPDHFSIKAWQEGYPARSVFKLQEIDGKHGLLKKGCRVLDIGAAPGSWSMWTAERIGPKGSVVAVDLKECTIPARYRNVTVLQGDAFSQAVREKLDASGPFDVILSDAAPATTGNRTVDTARSAALAEQCIAAAGSLLREGGSLVFKLFQGGEEQQLKQQLREMFTSVKTFKPKSSRKDSFEIFFIGAGFRPLTPTSPGSPQESREEV